MFHSSQPTNPQFILPFFHCPHPSVPSLFNNATFALGKIDLNIVLKNLKSSVSKVYMGYLRNVMVQTDSYSDERCSRWLKA